MSLAIADQIHTFQPMSQAQYTPSSYASGMSIDVEHSPHQQSQMSPPSSASSSNSSLLYPQMQRMDFASSPDPQHFAPHQAQQFHASQQSPSPASQQSSTLNPAQLRHSIGPSRVLTRRQARQAQQQASQLGIDLRNGHDAAHTPAYYSQDGFVMYGGTSEQSPPRPQTPSRIDSENAFHHQRSVSDISVGQNNVHAHAQMSPPNPSTPASTTSSSFSHYGFHPYGSHSRSTSSSTYPRSNSPAMSVMSAATSMSSTSSSRRLSSTNNILAVTPTAKQKKRLVNKERKEICEYFLEHPNARQEDIASLYGVERSTVSKILKHKEKWLNIPEGENNLVAKHRPSKFPEIEVLLQSWLADCRQDGKTISDSMIRNKAKDIAKSMHISEEKFKASSGWVENFKHRHNIRKGIWEGHKLSYDEMYITGGPDPDLTDELQDMVHATQHYADIHEAQEILERQRQESDHHQEVLMSAPHEVSPSAPIQVQLDEVKDPLPATWTMPSSQPIGISPQSMYRDPPATSNEQQQHSAIAGAHANAAVGRHRSSRSRHMSSLSQQSFEQQESMMTPQDGNAVALTVHDLALAQEREQQMQVQFNASASQQNPIAPPSPPQPPQQQREWIDVSGASNVSAQQASEAMNTVLNFIKTQPQGYLTLHESNVVEAVQKVLLGSANCT